MKQLSVFLLGAMALSACQKHDHTTAEPDKVNITLTSPNDGQIYHKGDTVRINAVVSYISELHAYEVSIKNKTTNEIVFSTYEHVHTDNFDVNTYWVNSLSANTQLTLSITVQIDHDGHEKRQEITLNNQL